MNKLITFLIAIVSFFLFDYTFAIKDSTVVFFEEQKENGVIVSTQNSFLFIKTNKKPTDKLLLLETSNGLFTGITYYEDFK